MGGCMNLAPLHPLFVHIPIALAVLMPMISVGLLVAWWRGVLPRRVWWIAVALQAVLVASGVAALRSGEADESRAETVVPESAIEAHEEAAEVFVIGSIGVLVIALAAGTVRTPRTAQALAALAAVGTLAVTGLGYRTGRAGGRLVYEHGAAAAYAEGAR